MTSTLPKLERVDRERDGPVPAVAAASLSGGELPSLNLMLQSIAKGQFRHLQP